MYRRFTRPGAISIELRAMLRAGLSQKINPQKDVPKKDWDTNRGLTPDGKHYIFTLFGYKVRLSKDDMRNSDDAGRFAWALEHITAQHEPSWYAFEKRKIFYKILRDVVDSYKPLLEQKSYILPVSLKTQMVWNRCHFVSKEKFMATNFDAIMGLLSGKFRNSIEMVKLVLEALEQVMNGLRRDCGLVQQTPEQAYAGLDVALAGLKTLMLEVKGA